MTNFETAKIDHHADAEKVAEGTEPITAETNEKLAKFKQSIRNEKLKLTFMERNKLRSLVDKLHDKTKDADFDALKKELQVDRVDKAVEGTKDLADTVGKKLDENPKLKYGAVIGGVILAFIAGRKLLFKGAQKTKDAAVGVFGKMKKVLVLGGIAALGLMGISYMSGSKASAGETSPEGSDKKAAASFDKLTKAVKDGSAAQAMAALAELNVLAKADPTLVAKYGSKELTDKDGKKQRLLPKPDGTFVLEPAEKVEDALTKAEAAIGGKDPEESAQILETLAKADPSGGLYAAFKAKFRERVIGGKPYLLMLDGERFRFIDKALHEKAIEEAKKTMTKTYENADQWADDISKVFVAIPGDVELGEEIVKACGTKEIAGKKYVLQLKGGAIEVRESRGLASLDEGVNLKGGTIDFDVADGPNVIKAKLISGAEGAKPVMLEVNGKQYTISFQLVGKTTVTNDILVSAIRKGNDMELRGKQSFIELKRSVPIAELERAVVAISKSAAPAIPLKLKVFDDKRKAGEIILTAEKA